MITVEHLLHSRKKHRSILSQFKIHLSQGSLECKVLASGHSQNGWEGLQFLQYHTFFTKKFDFSWWPSSHLKVTLFNSSKPRFRMGSRGVYLSLFGLFGATYFSLKSWVELISDTCPRSEGMFTDCWSNDNCDPRNSGVQLYNSSYVPTRESH